MIVCDISNVLAGGTGAGVVAGVRHEIRLGHLVLLLVLHHVFYHRVMATLNGNYGD